MTREQVELLRLQATTQKRTMQHWAEAMDGLIHCYHQAKQGDPAALALIEDLPEIIEGIRGLRSRLVVAQRVD